MTTYITRSSNSSPVAVKAGGSQQGRIGKSVEINVIGWDGNWARFNSPVIIENEENWIRGDYISPVDEPEPPTPTVKPIRSVVELDDGSTWEATEFTQLS